MAPNNIEPLSGRTYSLTSPVCPADALTVIRFTGTEEISRPYRFEIEFVCSGLTIDNLLNHEAVFAISGAFSGEKAIYRGLIVEIEELRRISGMQYCRAVLMPHFSKLAGSFRSEVYLDNSTLPQVIAQVFQDGGVLASEYEMRLHRDYAPCPFFCQYEESYLDFAARLMEGEGIYFFFETREDREMAVIVDDRTAHVPLAKTFYYHEEALRKEDDGEATIPVLSMRRRIIPARLVMRAFNYRKSALDLTVSMDVKSDGSGEIVLADERYETPEAGNRLAKIRTEELLCRERIYCGESSAVGLKAGAWFRLEEHYRDEWNQEYLVTEISHKGVQHRAFLSGLDGMLMPDEGEENYRNRFTLIPASLQFRPERRTIRPKIHGSLPAVADGEGTGQYAELNEQGEYKVRFLTLGQRRPDGKGSAWMRMNSPYSGDEYGMHFPLHKGTEVQVMFRDGDPDLPYIAGSLPNSTHRSVVTSANQEQNVLRTAGNNTFTLGDQEGQAFASLSTAAGNRLDMKDDKDAGAGVVSSRLEGKGIGLQTASGDQTVQLRDDGEEGEIILAASTPLKAFGVAAPDIPHVQENVSRIRVGQAASGIDITTNESVNRLSLVADSSISLGNHSALAIGVKNSFAVAADMAVAAGPHARKYLWGGSEYSARKISRLSVQEYFNVSSQCIIGAKTSVAIGGGMLPSVALAYESLTKAFFVGLAATVAFTAGGCTAAILHAEPEFRMGITAASLAVTLLMAKIQNNYVNAVKYVPPATSYSGSLELDALGVRMSANPDGGFLSLSPAGGVLASDITTLNSVNVSKAGITATGAMINMKADTVASIQGETAVAVKSAGPFLIQGSIGQVKVGSTGMILTQMGVQLSGAIVKVG